MTVAIIILVIFITIIIVALRISEAQDEKEREKWRQEVQQSIEERRQLLARTECTKCGNKGLKDNSRRIDTITEYVDREHTFSGETYEITEKDVTIITESYLECLACGYEMGHATEKSTRSYQPHEPGYKSY